MTPDYSGTGDYRRRILAAITACLAGRGPAAPMARRTLPGPGSAITVTAPANLLDGLRVTAGLSVELGVLVRSWTQYARSDGYTWGEIASARDIKAGPGFVPASAVAFRHVASDLGRGLTFAWPCGACGAMVTDHGPEVPPGEAETGHAAGCARMAEAIAAWEDESNE